MRREKDSPVEGGGSRGSWTANPTIFLKNIPIDAPRAAFRSVTGSGIQDYAHKGVFVNVTFIR